MSGPDTDIPTGPHCPRKHVRRVACQNYLTGFCPLGPECPRGQCVKSIHSSAKYLYPSHISPKPDIPTSKDYNPPSPPSPKELGPPPPGFGRYADFDRGSGAMAAQNNHGQSGNYTGPRRNLDEVLCFKVCQHFSLVVDQYS